jgi:serine protease inhibitor
VCGKKTQNEILRALCCTGDKADIVSDIIRNSIIGDSRISKCHIGNSFWVHASVPIQEDILSEVCKAHHSDAFMGEMGSGEINSAIQQWLNNNTGDTMKEHASVCTDRNTLFELFSASLFKAKWCDEFCPSQTQKDCFHVDMSTDVYCYFIWGGYRYNVNAY